MVEHRITTTDQEIDAAIERARLLDGEPLAKTVEHDQRLNVLVVSLTNGRRLVLPVEELQGLEGATHRQLQNYELAGGGTGISWPNLNADLYVPSLIEGRYGTRCWMADLGRKGGAAKTQAKQLASRANGAKGGRPRNESGSKAAVIEKLTEPDSALLFTAKVSDPPSQVAARRKDGPDQWRKIDRLKTKTAAKPPRKRHG
jgi:hypothetical protein